MPAAAADCCAPNTPGHGRACPGHPRLAYTSDMPGGFVYIVSNRRDGILYVGVTSDLSKRTTQHREGLIAGFTRRHNLKTLVYYEQFDDIRVAIQRERTMKQWPRAWKVRLIHGFNPEWRDLYPTLF
jgi:putative endonuclease